MLHRLVTPAPQETASRSPRIRPRWSSILGAGLVVLCVGSCAGPAPAERRPPGTSARRGEASWYGARFHGRRTASGERFDQHAMTAAHRSLPFGTVVRVTNERNGRSVRVRINDRGPAARRRIIDLSRAAAAELDMIADGVAPVIVEVLEAPRR